MATEKFARAEAAKQTVFGTAASSGHFLVPAVGEYTDAQEHVTAVWDRGTWTTTEIVERVAQYATFTTEGAGFFELLPVFFSAGFADMPPEGSNPYYYDEVIAPTNQGVPQPYTWLFGSREAIGGTGPASRIQDSYCQEIVLTGNINTKEVTVRSSWFGLYVDDNSGAGYAMTDAALPTPLGMMRTLLGAIAVQDAAAAGNNFGSLTAITNSMLDWSLTIRTGLEPLWVSDSNQITYAGVRWVEPTLTFAPTFRANSTVYPLVRSKYDTRTYQELRLTLTGDSSRQVIFKVTGRWTAVPSATNRGEGEQVLKPVFTAATPHTQTSAKHWLGVEIDTLWSHSGGGDLLLVEDGSTLLGENGSPRLLG